MVATNPVKKITFLLPKVSRVARAKLAVGRFIVTLICDSQLSRLNFWGLCNYYSVKAIHLRCGLTVVSYLQSLRWCSSDLLAILLIAADDSGTFRNDDENWPRLEWNQSHHFSRWVDATISLIRGLGAGPSECSSCNQVFCAVMFVSKLRSKL